MPCQIDKPVQAMPLPTPRSRPRPSVSTGLPALVSPCRLAVPPHLQPIHVDHSFQPHPAPTYPSQPSHFMSTCPATPSPIDLPGPARVVSTSRTVSARVVPDYSRHTIPSHVDFPFQSVPLPTIRFAPVRIDYSCHAIPYRLAIPRQPLPISTVRSITSLFRLSSSGLTLTDFPVRSVPRRRAHPAQPRTDHPAQYSPLPSAADRPRPLSPHRQASPFLSLPTSHLTPCPSRRSTPLLSISTSRASTGLLRQSTPPLPNPHRPPLPAPPLSTSRPVSTHSDKPIPTRSPPMPTTLAIPALADESTCLAIPSRQHSAGRYATDRPSLPRPFRRPVSSHLSSTSRATSVPIRRAVPSHLQPDLPCRSAPSRQSRPVPPAPLRLPVPLPPIPTNRPAASLCRRATTSQPVPVRQPHFFRYLPSPTFRARPSHAISTLRLLIPCQPMSDKPSHALSSRSDPTSRSAAPCRLITTSRPFSTFRTASSRATPTSHACLDRPLSTSRPVSVRADVPVQPFSSLFDFSSQALPLRFD
jgi:hypothetical protein